MSRRNLLQTSTHMSIQVPNWEALSLFAVATIYMAVQVHLQCNSRSQRPIYVWRLFSMLSLLRVAPFLTRSILHKTVLEQPATSEILIWSLAHGRNTVGGALDWICPCLNPHELPLTDHRCHPWKFGTWNAHALCIYNWAPRVCESGHLCMQGEDQLSLNT